jgi:hypothetical protein
MTWRTPARRPWPASFDVINETGYRYTASPWAQDGRRVSLRIDCRPAPLTKRAVTRDAAPTLTLAAPSVMAIAPDRYNSFVGSFAVESFYRLFSEMSISIGSQGGLPDRSSVAPPWRELSQRRRIRLLGRPDDRGYPWAIPQGVRPETFSKCRSRTFPAFIRRTTTTPGSTRRAPHRLRAQLLAKSLCLRTAHAGLS